MQDFGALDEVDSSLVHALQISPRASWARIAKVLGLDAVTLARRWSRLTEQGAAWISCYPGPALAASGYGCLAFIEVDCANGQLLEVAEQLTRQPMVSTVEHVTGDRDLLLTVMTTDLATLSHWSTTVLGALPGVTARRIHLVGAIYVEGSRWRLRALRPAQVARLAADQPPRGHRPGPVTLTDLDRRIIVALSADGRAPYTALAERCGASVDTVRRRTRRLLDEGAVHARCEIARPLSKRPVAAVLWAGVPADTVEQAARGIAGMGDIRLCAGITGRHNLLIVAWVRSVDDIQRLETRVTEKVPGIVISDRAVALWPMKLSGHLLDEHGYRLGTVPIDGWSTRRAGAPGSG
ncbi:Lrp/AsnC family transcriptional regulator [Streptomyces sp. CT34]|uniref:Lrp/AsnC family transcriptional regulator n=1 Tax=Streptomyces sp. CT34 TaxID=1553907 RepID=UPI0005BD0C43|nr:Lrp/AsnC family transcriptional regulator [Streptomyces sp. CT34]